MSSIHISLVAEPIFEWGPLVINNSLILGLLGSLVITVLFVMAGRLVRLYPNRGRSHAVETICEIILDMIEKVTHDRAKAIRFFPLLMTLFTFIAVNNWLGLVPGVGTITIMTSHGAVPLLRPAAADLNTTLALAVISVVMTQIYAVKELGVIAHLKKYISFNPIMLFVGFLELIAEFSKMISFSFRLFGNIFAGEVLLVVVAYIAPALAPLPFFFLELFVGLVQALVFTMLSLVFLEIATTSHSGHNEKSEDSVEVRATHNIPASTAGPLN